MEAFRAVSAPDSHRIQAVSSATRGRAMRCANGGGRPRSESIPRRLALPDLARRHRGGHAEALAGARRRGSCSRAATPTSFSSGPRCRCSPTPRPQSARSRGRGADAAPAPRPRRGPVRADGAAAIPGGVAADRPPGGPTRTPPARARTAHATPPGSRRDRRLRRDPAAPARGRRGYAARSGTRRLRRDPRTRDPRRGGGAGSAPGPRRAATLGFGRTLGAALDGTATDDVGGRRTTLSSRTQGSHVTKGGSSPSRRAVYWTGSTTAARKRRARARCFGSGDRIQVGDTVLVVETLPG